MRHAGPTAPWSGAFKLVCHAGLNALSAKPIGSGNNDQKVLVSHAPSQCESVDLGSAPCLQDAKRMCREIVKIARVLSTKRDMGLNELKLTVAVEDPRVKERRSMGIEVSLSRRILLKIFARSSKGCLCPIQKSSFMLQQNSSATPRAFAVFSKIYWHAPCE